MNSRANYRTKEIRLLFVACSLIAVTAISAIAQDKDVAEVLAGGCFKALEVELEEGRTEYKVDVGDFPMHRGLAVEVKVFNSTEADLDLAVVRLHDDKRRQTKDPRGPPSQFVVFCNSSACGKGDGFSASVLRQNFGKAIQFQCYGASC